MSASFSLLVLEHFGQLHTEDLADAEGDLEGGRVFRALNRVQGLTADPNRFGELLLAHLVAIGP